MTNTMTQDSRQNPQAIVNRVTSIGIIGNVILSLFKFMAGILGHSSAMVSDAIHSLSDVLATFIAWLGIRLSMQAPDREHPYGHERLECVASLLLGAILFGTGLMIGLTGLRTILTGHYDELQSPGSVALIAAVVSIATKEGMFWYTRHYAKVLNSAAFMADAWHHRSDALSSIGSLIGIGGAMLGFPILDPLASVAIAVCIIKVAYDILKDAVSKMLDTACSTEYEKQLADFIAAQDGVDRLDVLHTRMFGNKIYIDAEISVNGDQSLTAAHEIAEQVHNQVEQNFDNIKHIMIHVNPMI